MKYKGKDIVTWIIGAILFSVVLIASACSREERRIAGAPWQRREGDAQARKTRFVESVFLAARERVARLCFLPRSMCT
jgi:hypothetical protein